MTRLAFQLDRREDDYRAAASRIHDVQIVELDASPDAVVSSDNHASFDKRPVLLVERYPLYYRPWLFPAQPWRFAPDVQAIRASLEAGKLGKPGLLRMHVWEPASRPLWLGLRASAVDLALWLLGEQPDAIYGTLRKAKSEPCQLIHLGFPSNAMAMLDFTNALPRGEGYRSLSVIGSRGAAYADDHRDRNLLFDGGAPSASPPDRRDAFIGPMLESFVAAVREERTSDVATRDYRRAEDVVRSAWKMATGNQIEEG